MLVGFVGDCVLPPLRLSSSRIVDNMPSESYDVELFIRVSHMTTFDDGVIESTVWYRWRGIEINLHPNQVATRAA